MLMNVGTKWMRLKLKDTVLFFCSGNVYNKFGYEDLDDTGREITTS